MLERLLAAIAADEVRHAQSASDLLAKRIERDREGTVPLVLEAASRFRHFGGDVVADVPIALPGDEIAIRTFARRVERLCGLRLVDWLKSRI